MELKTEIISNYDEFLKLALVWDDLLQRSYFNSFMGTHSWLCLWWKAFGEGKELRVIIVSDGKQLLAAAPLQLGKAYCRGLPVKELSCLSNEHVPEIDFLVDKQHLEVFSLLFTAICQIKGWNVFRLENIPATSPLWPAWEAFFTKHNFLYNRKIGLISPYLTIDKNWEDYYASLSSKFRKVLRNKINRLEKGGVVEVEEICHFTSQEVEENMFRISAKSWKAKYGKDLVSDPSLKKFFQELTLLAAKKNWLKLWVLKLNGQAIAFEYHLLYGQKSWALRADFDEDYRQLRPGSYLDAKILQQLFTSSAVTCYYMGGRDDFYKQNWSKSVAAHEHGFVFSPTFYGRRLYQLEFILLPVLRKNPLFRALKKQSECFSIKTFKDPKQRETD